MIMEVVRSELSLNFNIIKVFIDQPMFCGLVFVV